MLSQPGDSIALPPDPFGPAMLGPVRLRNRVLKAATFEGMSPGGVVTESLIDFHRRMRCVLDQPDPFIVR